MKKDKSKPMLQHLISLEKPIRLPDEGGGFETSWQEITQIYAHIRVLGGKEVFQAGQTQGDRQYELIIRFHSEVTTSNRFNWHGRILDIVRVDNHQAKNSWLVCRCVERFAN